MKKKIKIGNKKMVRVFACMADQCDQCENLGHEFGTYDRWVCKHKQGRKLFDKHEDFVRCPYFKNGENEK